MLASLRECISDAWKFQDYRSCHKLVAGKSENHFVVVFKKFALDEKKEVVVELDEESGNRNLSLKIGHEIINNPIHF